MKCTIKMGSDDMTHTPSFMQIGTGVGEILRVFFNHFKGCNVGINDWRDS